MTEHERQRRFGIGDKLTGKQPGFERVAESRLEGLVGSADILSPIDTFAAAAFKLTSVHLRRASG